MKELDGLIAKATRGEPDAAAFLTGLHRIVDIWDDLIDKDKPVDDAAINAAFYAALVAIPRNPFYRAHFALLSPLIESAIIDWHTANALEKTGGDDLRTAHALRCAGYSVLIMCARIIGGVEWAEEVSLELRSGQSDWAEYAEKHKVA